MQTKTVKQNSLSSECWEVQIWGTSSCSHCPYKDTKNCGGKNILKTGRNKKGYVIGKTDKIEI